VTHCRDHPALAIFLFDPSRHVPHRCLAVSRRRGIPNLAVFGTPPTPRASADKPFPPRGGNYDSAAYPLSFRGHPYHHGPARKHFGWQGGHSQLSSMKIPRRPCGFWSVCSTGPTGPGACIRSPTPFSGGCLQPKACAQNPARRFRPRPLRVGGGTPHPPPGLGGGGGARLNATESLQSPL